MPSEPGAHPLSLAVHGEKRPRLHRTVVAPTTRRLGPQSRVLHLRKTGGREASRKQDGAKYDGPTGPGNLPRHVSRAEVDNEE